MKIVIQKVQEAKVEVENKIVGSIGNGLLLLVGVVPEDTLEDIKWIAKKITQMRIFSDEDGKMNRSLIDVEGEILVVSQFTLMASTKKGNRPSFIKAAQSEFANSMFEPFKKEIQMYIKKTVQSGVFGAHMNVSLVNDGPITIVIDSKNKE